jgi:hypothetical protein
LVPPASCARRQDYRSHLADPQVLHNGLVDQLLVGEAGVFPVIKSPMTVGGPA